VIDTGILKVKKCKQNEINSLRERARRGVSDDIIYLHPECDNYNDKISSRVMSLNLPRQVRKDAVVTVQVVVALKKEELLTLTDSEQTRFYNDSYQLLKATFGGNRGINIIDCFINCNTHPVLYFFFIPVTADKGTLSAKDVLSRYNLIKLHKQFDDQIWGKYLSGVSSPTGSGSATDPNRNGKRQIRNEKILEGGEHDDTGIDGISYQYELTLLRALAKSLIDNLDEDNKKIKIEKGVIQKLKELKQFYNKH
jgi:hypothetical protein